MSRRKKGNRTARRTSPPPTVLDEELSHANADVLAQGDESLSRRGEHLPHIDKAPIIPLDFRKMRDRWTKGDRGHWPAYQRHYARQMGSLASHATAGAGLDRKVVEVVGETLFAYWSMLNYEPEDPKFQAAEKFFARAWPMFGPKIAGRKAKESDEDLVESKPGCVTVAKDLVRRYRARIPPGFNVTEAERELEIHRGILEKMAAEDIPVPPLPPRVGKLFGLAAEESPPAQSFRLTVDQLIWLGVPRQPDRIARRLMQLFEDGPSADRIKKRLSRGAGSSHNRMKGQRSRKRGSKS